MTWILVKNEFLKKIHDSRINISIITTVLLVIFSTFFLVKDYQKQILDYEENERNYKKGLEQVYVYSQLEPVINYKPHPFSIFNKGISENIAKSIPIKRGWIPRQRIETKCQNLGAGILGYFDLTKVFQLILSLLAILLVYDAISGEREDGVLKLILTSMVCRKQIFLAKLYSYILILAVPTLISLIGSILVLNIFYGIGFSLQDWLSIGIMFFVTIIYLAFFVVTGLYISVFTRKSNVSLAVITFLWIFIVVVQPNLGSYIASASASLPDVERVENDIEGMWKEFSEQERNLQKNVYQKFERGSAVGSWEKDGSEKYVVWDGTQNYFLLFNELTAMVEPLRIDYSQKEWDFYYNEYHTKLERQQKIETAISLFAPASMFDECISLLSGTDIGSFDRFIHQVREYRKDFIYYLEKEKKLFSSNTYSFFTPLDQDQRNKDNYLNRMKSQKPFSKIDFEPLQLDDVPVFNSKAGSMIQFNIQILVKLILIVVYSIVIFLVAARKFVTRFDVR